MIDVNEQLIESKLIEGRAYDRGITQSRFSIVPSGILTLIQNNQRSARAQQSFVQPVSIADLLALPDEKLEWLWEDYLAVGDLAVFSAYMKVGKSTLFYPLALAVARGTSFLNRQTKQGGVLILALEEHLRDVKLRLKKLGVQSSDPIYIQSGPVPCTPDGVKAIKEFAQEHKISLVIIDSLSSFWAIKDENNNAEVQKTIKPVLEFAHGENVTVLLVHHESKHGGKKKGGGSDGRAIRGASALFGVVDQALSLGHPQGSNEKRRVLRSIGRRSESPAELIIELDGDTKLSSPAPYRYKVVGTPKEMDKAEQQKKVGKLLTAEWLTIAEILEDAKLDNLTEKQVRDALKVLHNEGKAVRTGTGSKSSPFEYRVPLAGDPGGCAAVVDKDGQKSPSESQPEDSCQIPSEGSTNPLIRKETNEEVAERGFAAVGCGDFVSSEIAPYRAETETNPPTAENGVPRADIGTEVSCDA
jgi:hypothetical protein